MITEFFPIVTKSISSFHNERREPSRNLERWLALFLTQYQIVIPHPLNTQEITQATETAFRRHLNFLEVEITQNLDMIKKLGRFTSQATIIFIRLLNIP